MPPPRPILLSSLGHSWAVVPEAFHFLPPGPDGYAAVHVLTTTSDAIDRNLGQLLDYFRSRFPDLPVTCTRVADFRELRHERDHAEFEEVLYRWMLDVAPEPSQRHVCLAGGLKTMSAAMQQAASMLGAHQVFHVLAQGIPWDPTQRPREPRTADEIDEALRRGLIHFVRLGGQARWPQLANHRAADYPLDTIALENRIRTVRAPDRSLTRAVRDIIARSIRIAESWPDLDDLPFPEIAAWARADLEWLREPVEHDSPRDRSWIVRLPKVELHTHLGGFASHGPELARVRAAASRPGTFPIAPQPPDGWPLPRQPCDLRDYMKLGDATGSALLKDPGCLRAHCEALYAHFLEQGVLHAEVRCSPGNYAQNDRSAWEVLADIRDTFNRCMHNARQHPGPFCHVNLLIIATRRDRGDFRASISRHLALAVTAAEHWTDTSGCRVVGVDLAGYEDPTTRAHYFREEFTAVHRCGLALTVHAGENDDAEGIWRAVFDLNARRLGHALHLIDSPELMRSVADRGIGVEMCPYANVQIKGFKPFNGTREYPLNRYLSQGILATVNTDNIGISAASITDNLLLAARLDPRLTRLDILRLLRNALDTAFLQPDERRRLAARMAALLHPSQTS